MSHYILILLSVFFNSTEKHTVTTYELVGLTASGLHTDDIAEPFVAVSRDLLKKHPLHSYLKLSGCEFNGEYIVLDKMNKRIKNTIDVYRPAIPKGVTECRCEKVEKSKK